MGDSEATPPGGAQGSNRSGHTPDAADSSTLMNMSDDDLIADVWAGDIAALDELWQRHSMFGRVAAAAQAGDRADAVSERAWVRILGGVAMTGPAFRPYLYAQVREAAGAPAPAPDWSAERMAQALATLLHRWQEVLWYMDV